MDTIKHTWELPEEPHPFLKQVTMRVLRSRRDDGADVTCILVRCPAGAEVERHVHPGQDDLIYIVEGKATMWIEGEGEFSLTPGTFVAVPRGKQHRTFNVEEDLLIYDTFSPPLF
ncbi:MAG: cupin domain-containing protein [Deltaproteobacteria bacterium]|nr:cupin domain-containing protein [Deltaproteobacteria bacterium]